MIALVGWLLRFIGGLCMLGGLAILLLCLVLGGAQAAKSSGAGHAVAYIGGGALLGLIESASALAVGAVLYLLGRALKPQEYRRRSRTRIVHVRGHR